MAYSSEGLRLQASDDTIHLLARSEGVSRNLCASLVGDVTRVEGRLASAEGRRIRIGRVGGCHTVRHVTTATRRVSRTRSGTSRRGRFTAKPAFKP